jgi:hypothetical protein
MTALKEFDRLEATGLWRATPEDQRREVIVSMGDATLTIASINGEILGHWSIAAVARANPGQMPAIYHPDGDPGQTLELAEEETVLREGLDRVLQAIDRRRPRPGKLRLILGGALTLGLALGGVFWLPDALERYAVNVVPQVKRAEIGASLLQRMQRVTGMPCRDGQAVRPLDRLALRILGPGSEGRVVVLPQSMPHSAHLPGGIILLNRSVVEDYEDPDIAAGYVLAEAARALSHDPLADLLDHAGLLASLRLITTGNLPPEVLDSYAELLLSKQGTEIPPQALLPYFSAAQLRSAPYAYSVDITGESTLPLIEGDPHRSGATRPALSDSDWVRLQGICGA